METIYDEKELEILDKKDSFQKPTQEQVNHYKENALFTKVHNLS